MVDKAVGISSEGVFKATGRTWDEWFALLDAEGTSKLAHAPIANLVHERFGASDWWSQMVTVAYEQERGLRARHEMSDGFSVSRSKTFDVPVGTLYFAWIDAASRSSWLPDIPLTVRKAVETKSLRFQLGGESSTVEARFTAKGPDRSQVSVQHSKLSDAESAESYKRFWSAALDRLKTLLAE